MSLILDGSNGITAGSSNLSNTELGYLDGLTSNVQTQLNSIRPTLSGVTSYHLLSGSLALSNSVITNGFATKLYTGNGTTQSVVTDVDMATQWGNSASETFGGLVWGKGRSGATSHYFVDTVRGATKDIYSNATTAETTEATGLTAFNNNGFSLGTLAGLNTNVATYASWNFQTTHRTSSTTNHGKAYTCHYNPFTGFTIVKYEGSGLAGHEIPHHLGRKLGLVTTKNLSAAVDWHTQYKESTYMLLNTTAAEGAITTGVTNFGDTSTTIGINAVLNTSTNQYIMYGWANSYFDEANTLLGNYEVGIYQGTGVAGNKVTTRGKPAWVMVKRLDSANNWTIWDNLRNNIASDGYIYPNSAAAEVTGDAVTFLLDGFTLQTISAVENASGGQYLYMAVYDNDSSSGKSKYPRATDTSYLNLNATVPFANGIDANGTKNSIITKNETVAGLTLTQGKNYVYAKNDGTYGISAISPKYSNVNPASGDFYNVLENKWYTSEGVAITESRNYLNAIVYADAGGQPTYVEQLPKIEYKDIVKANEFQGNNACTAWVNFDGTTTPPTIRDSFNVSAVIRTSTGVYDVYFKTAMDNVNYDCLITANRNLTSAEVTSTGNAWSVSPFNQTNKKVSVANMTNSSGLNTNMYVQIFGGKN